MIEKSLEEMGLSKNESAAYLSLLELGQGTVSSIAKHAKLHRSNTHDALQKLIGKDLITYHSKDKSKYYEPCDPKNLFNVLKQKEMLLSTIVPELSIKYTYSKSKSDTHIHEGIVAFRNIMLEQLNNTKNIYVLGVPSAAVNMISKSFLEKFHDMRIKKGISFYHLLNSDYDPARVKYLQDMKYTYAKKLPGSYASLVGVNIFDQEMILTLWIDPIITIEIKNKEMADAYKDFFKIMWGREK